MVDVHEVEVERRRWRIWPIVVTVLVALLAIAVVVAMIMNIHGSISWPAGNIGFGFPPRAETPATTVIESATKTAANERSLPLSPAPPPGVQTSEPVAPPAAEADAGAPVPAESDPIPAE